MGEQEKIAEKPQEAVHLEIEGELASIFLGGTSATVVILTEKRLKSFREAIKQISTNSNVKGLVIYGGSEKIFCAGADIHAIAGVSDPKKGEELAKAGQDVFDELEALSCTTVAAISGACVGGGCELVLACDYRVAADIPPTKIGLPEVKLGIVPGFGGTQRLPRLIGLPQALNVILQGRTLAARQAKKVGLVDELVSDFGEKTPTSAIEEVAVAIALGKKKPVRTSISLRDKFLSFTSIGRRIVESKARTDIQKNTKGKYPAPPKALEVACFGLQKGLKEGLKAEAEALGATVVTPESKSLVHLFFLTESAGKIGKGAKSDISSARAAVIGGGTMGAGIASSLVSKGIPTVIVELNEDARARAKKHVESYIEKRRGFSDSQKKECLEKLTISADLAAAKEATLVVEAIVEDLNIKKEVFSKLSEIVSPETILASNTSSLSITECASAVANAERVIGMHFFNPAEKMPLVEIIRGEQTSDRAVAYTAALASKLGKHPVVVEDVRGFLVNRLLSPYLVEAAHLLSEGYPATTIDKVAEDFGMPMGPLRLLDEIGLDVASKVTKIMIDAYGERMKGPRSAEQLVSLGRLGKKSGQGFYIHEGKDARIEENLRELLDLPETKKPEDVNKEEIQNRLIYAMVNEAIRCLDEGVAGVPGKESAGQVDLATVMGTGFAPFRGGVIHYANSVGAKKLSGQLKDLKKRCGERFAPAEGLEARAKKKAGFYQSPS